MTVLTDSVAQEPHDIAIVGIGCRLPGGVEDPRALWKLLSDGVDAVGDIPTDRWDPDRYFAVEQAPGRMSSRRAGCLDRADTFDAEFFGIVPRIADQMDPQQRLLLETAWAALEDAGIPPTFLTGSTTGVYMGACSHDYGDIQSAATELAGLDAHSATGNFTSIVANRLSYVLDLRGPSMTVDTACSSSLVAVHLACSGLRRGECDLALVGGVNVMLSPHFSISLSQAAMLSPNGLSRAFDAAADGYVRGEGAGVVVLKPLSAALRDHDRVYAVIKGSAVNQDGRTPGITVPSEDSQRVNFLAAVRQAGVSTAEIGYVEAHGTGTPVGDPIEATALGKVLNTDSERGPDQRALIGSIKTNIGHLEAGAGIAGLIKAALAVHHRVIPPSLHFSRPNPQIDFEKWRLAVPAKAEQWPDGYQRAVASVNSFGFGGTNANVVLAEAPVVTRASQVRTHTAKPHVLTFSARSEPALSALAQAYADSWEGSDAVGDIAGIAGALARRRAHHDHRIAVIASDPQEAAASLRTHLETGRAPLVGQGHRRPGAARKLAFVFNGQGPQWWAMGRQLLEEEPVFRQAVEQCDVVARELIEWSILAELLATEEESRVQRTFVLQPCIFAVQFGLVALWRSWGVEPDGVVGHSLGDISAACVAGLIDLRTALRIICHRSRIQDKADPEGGMLYATISPLEAENWCRRFPDELWLSAVNSQQAITLSGMRPVLGKVQEELQAEGVFSRILRVNCACHSPSMDPLRAELMERIGQVQAHEGELPFYSTVAGHRLSGSAISAEYFWENFRQPVAFAAAMGAMLDDGYDLFVEVSPHPVLSQAMRDVLRESGIDGVVLPSLKRGEDERRSLLSSLSTLYVEGADLRWETHYPDPVLHVDLPLNPWQREPYWHESKVGVATRKAAQAHTIIQRVDAPLPTWETQWDDHRLTWVQDHHVFGGVVIPGAAYVEMALSATAELTGKRCVLEHIHFERPCVLTEGEPAMTRIVLHPDSSSFEIHSRMVRDDVWTRHVKGRFWPQDGKAATERAAFDLDQIRARCPEAYSALDIYENMSRKGYTFGPSFCGIQRYHAGFGEALARVEPPLVLKDRTPGYTIHPALLDACLQSGILVPARMDGSQELLQFTYLPTQAASVRVHASPESGRPFWTYVQSHRADPAGFAFDAYILSDTGEVLAEFLGFTGNRVDDAETRRDPLSDHLYRLAWRDAPSVRESTQTSPVAAGGLASVHDEIANAIPGIADEIGRRAYHERYAPRVAELCTLYLIRCLRELGIAVEPGAELEQTMFAQVLPEFHGWLRASLDFLVRGRILAQRGSGFDVVALPGDRGTSGAADPDAVFSDLAQTHTACHPELTTLRRTGPALARVIRGEQDPLTLLFPAGNHDATEALYHTAPISHLYNILVRQAVRRIVEQTGPERVVRVLEIGAGTGGLTAHLLPVLPAERTRYHFTDVSAAFLHSAQEKFASYPFVTFGTLDLEQDPRDQGYSAGGYDLVIASDAVHATADLATSLANIRRLLAPGGVVALIEAMPDNPWLHLTFGLTEGWWRFQDRDIRSSGPLLPAEDWLNLLRQGGFEDPVSLSDVAEGNGSGQFVLLARKPWPDHAASDNVAPDVDDVRDTGPAGNWLIFADQGGLGSDLAKTIQSAGGRCVVVRHSPTTSAPEGGHTVAPGDAAAIQEIVGDVPWRGVVHLWNLDVRAAEPDEAALDQAVVTGSLSVAHVMSALARNHDPATGKANLFILTRGAQPVLTKDISLAQAPVWGLALVGGLELPEVRCRMIDLSPAPGAGEAEQVWRQLQHDDNEREVALRGADRLVRRLSRLPAADRLGTVPSSEILRRGDAFELTAAAKGTLDRLVYVAKSRVQPGRGEVEVEVRAAGLNFLDVMTALGQVPRRDEREQGLGGECAGVVTRVGDSVTALAVGDEVVVVRGDQGAIASHVTVDARYVFRKPPAMSFEEACQLPIAFLTAWYALARLARVEKGDKVLIHAATGGTGLACLQVAQMLGAEVFATAGSEEKQDYLRALGIVHVMPSRSLDFADHVRRVTDGQGVDVVVNSLAGEAASRGIACLAPYGRFVEIGKRDFLTDANLHLRPFLDNLSYFSFDLRQMLADRPDRVRDEFLRLLEEFEAGRLRPLPHRAYLPAQVQQAFRNMVNAGHIGKLVISMRGTPVPVSPQPRRRAVSAGGTWLLAGGLGGFGLRMAEHLARTGVRHLVLLGRTITEQARQRVHDIAHETSAQIRLEAVDICDRPSLRALIEDIEANLPPLKGVVHCAMVLDDKLVTDLDEAAMLKVVRPKMVGAWHLHELTAGAPLEAFVLFSSMTSMLGNQGQGNYAVANTFLDALAHHRRAKGLPATCVNWGVIADAGYVARQPGLRDQLAAIGAGGIDSAEALNLLTELIDSDHPQVGAFRIDWARYATVVRPDGPDGQPRYAEIFTADQPRAARSSATSTALDELHQQLGADLVAVLEDKLRRRLSIVLGLAPDKLDVDLPLTEYLDSLLVTEIVVWLARELGVDYTLMDIMKGPTVRQLAVDLALRISSAADLPEPMTVATDEPR